MVRPLTHHGHRHTFTVHYPRTRLERIWGILIAPTLFIVALGFLIRFSGFYPTTIGSISLHDLLLASIYTSERLLIAYILAIICGVPLAILVTRSLLVQKIFLP